MLSLINEMGDDSTFVSEPVGDKPSSSIPGMTSVGADLLGQAGFERASLVVGKWLVMGKNESAFRDWLRSIVGDEMDDGAVCKAVSDYVCAWV